VAYAVRRFCSDFMDMLRRLISCIIIIIINQPIFLQLRKRTRCTSQRPYYGGYGKGTPAAKRVWVHHLKFFFWKFKRKLVRFGALWGQESAKYTMLEIKFAESKSK